MKTQITLETKEIRKIIARFLQIREEQVIPQRYSYAVEGVTAEEIRRRLGDENGAADP